MSDLQINSLNSPAGLQAIQGSRPVFNKQTGEVIVHTKRGLRVNSALRKDEWESLDAAVVEAARQRLVGIMHLRERGLLKNEGSIGVLMSQYNTVSELTAADVNMSGRTEGTKDRLDYALNSVPLPVISKGYDIGARELEASRRMGASLDTSHAFAASQVVSEKLEEILFNGYSSINFQGSTIYGYTTHPSVNSDTAGNFGGGDWATAGNGAKTVGGMIARLQGDRMYGPYQVYAAPTQYGQATTLFNTDGSGDTEADRILRLPNVIGFSPGDFLTDGYIVVVQMTRDVVDLAYVPGFELVNLEWASGDGMTDSFKVVTVAIPRVKADYNGRSGVALATGA